VVGWSLSRHIDADLAVAALEQALAGRQPRAGWIHHSDRGVQYACRDYVERLDAARAQVSMSAKGTPRENAQAESFFRTLKHEEVNLSD
jgi:transposase InsO family protein